MEWDQMKIPVFFVDNFIYQIGVVYDTLLVASFDHLELALFWFIKHQLGRALFS